MATRTPAGGSGDVRARFEAGAARLFVCAGDPCRAQWPFAEREVDGFAGTHGLPLELTECLGPCERPCVASLRVGRRRQMFAGITSRSDWATVAEFARRAAGLNSLLVDPGAAQPLRFDPAHDDPGPSVRLHRLAFLLGHFEGEGRYAPGPGVSSEERFYKEMIGALEAGGRFLSLRMAVGYPLEDGRDDVHEALVIIGADTEDRALSARAYTDGGATRDFALELTESGLRFADVVTAHGRPPRPARKLLEPIPDGILERVELDLGDRGFAPYSTLILRRLP
jgi:hypothetical protein